MKKFLSIKNTQGIYVARASFSSDETVIDFVNSSDNCNTKPVSIIAVTPEQQRQRRASTTLNKSSSAIDAITSYDTISVPSTSSRSNSLLVEKSPAKKKLKAKVLKFLHLKKKPKMGDNLNTDDAAAAAAMPPTSAKELSKTTSDSYPMLPTPKLARSKGRTAALVKKFSLTPKKMPSKELSGGKKSGIPLRTATSVETISNATHSSALKNRIETTASVSHHSMSEMNLVNIDYRQESSGNNLDVGVKVGQTQYRSGNYQSGGSSLAVNSGTSNLTRAWNASSNLSIKSGLSLTNNDSSSGGGGDSASGGVDGGSGSKIPTGRTSASTEKLQITISGKKRANTIDSAMVDTQPRNKPHQFDDDTKPKRIERKALTMQQQQQHQHQHQHQLQSSPKKFNIAHDLTLMNTVGVPPAPTTQAPSSITTYRTATSTASIKNVVQSGIPFKAQSTMQSQQSVDSSASVENVGQIKRGPKRADTLVTVTSFDVEDPDDIAAASKFSSVEHRDSLHAEIIEAERRSSITMDASEQSNEMATAAKKLAQPSTSSEPSSGSETKPTSKIDIVPKVIIEEVSSMSIEKPMKSEKVSPSSDKSAKLNDDIDNELSTKTITQSDGAKTFQSDEDNEITAAAAAASAATASTSSHPTLQFERRNMSSSPEKREHLYKILVIGELGTGKTSFIKRYVHQFFSQNYRATIGVDFALKVLNWDQNTIIRLQLWDIAGQERFGNMTRVYYKEAVGAFIVFDVTRSATFDAVIKWKQDLDSKVQLPNGSPIPCILIANKCDQPKQGIVNTPAKMDDYVKEHGFAGWFETSAKENINIEEAARALVNKILLNDKIINAGEILDADKFNLDGSNAERPKKSCSC